MQLFVLVVVFLQVYCVFVLGVAVPVNLPRDQWPERYQGDTPLYSGTATTWCGDKSGNMCGLGSQCDGSSLACGALSDASFPDIIKCHCTSSGSCSNCGLPKCCSNSAPTCETGYCGQRWCVSCEDSKCSNRNTHNVTLADACPKLHPQNVDNCCSHNKAQSWCECVDPNVVPNLDLNCKGFENLAPRSVGQVRVQLPSYQDKTCSTKWASQRKTQSCSTARTICSVDSRRLSPRIC